MAGIQYKGWDYSFTGQTSNEHYRKFLRERKGMKKRLVIHEENCTGCHSCQMFCSLSHHHQCNLALSGIRIRKGGGGGSGENRLEVCRQCDDPSCLKACPTMAISRDHQSGGLVIDKGLCNGCQECIPACPWGGIWYEAKGDGVVKCDLCQGDPHCVKACLYGALGLEAAQD